MNAHSDFSVFAADAGRAAALLSAMANAKRLLVLCYLAESGEAPVARIAEEVGLSQSALSQHLAKLRGDGLVATRREAQTIHYRLDDERVLRLLTSLRDIFCPELGGAGRKGGQSGRR